VVKSQGHHCGDIELVGYLSNEADPVTLVMDLHITHDRVWSSTDPTLNGHLRHPNNLDQSLNDTDADKIRKYRADYNNRTPNAVSFMPAIASTSGRLHSEFVRLLFLQTHRETDRFFAASGVHLAKFTSDQFHFRRTVFGTPRRNDKQTGKEEKIIFGQEPSCWLLRHPGREQAVDMQDDMTSLHTTVYQMSYLPIPSLVHSIPCSDSDR
jgi:hypothetical protein